ncbi:hypothetical protein SDC9_154356 [bioreactor metagenome]|uniref:Uncharacterized protein n=1 Tax=bioreactor metagenome TaxID=1076179 RepID=A0A645F019_9ZZZZ
MGQRVCRVFKLPERDGAGNGFHQSFRCLRRLLHPALPGRGNNFRAQCLHDSLFLHGKLARHHENNPVALI